MSSYDERIRLLRQQIERKRHRESKLRELRAQREALREKVDGLARSKLDEQADVDRLEGRSLVAFFYGVTGKMDEKLDKERAEAYAAAVKYDAAARELSMVEEDIGRCEAELDALRDCERQYEQARRDKLNAIKAAGTREAEEIIRAEERISRLEGERKELREALDAGQAALATTDGILASLDSAEGWGAWDLFGGGIGAGLAKHGHLDEAQRQVEHLQVQLRRFKTELTDVEVSADIQISIDGFLSFADFFFDGLFADWAVLDHIDRAQTQVRETKAQIGQIAGRLSDMLRGTENGLATEQVRLNDLALRAGV